MSTRAAAFTRIAADGAAAAITATLAVEAPVAIEFNGIGHAVMMATPADLEDFAHGFALAERLIAAPADIEAVDIHTTDRGTILRITLAPARLPELTRRARHRIAESGCGLCGIENLEQAIRPLPRVAPARPIDPPAIFAALARMRDHQPLARATRAAHAALLCAADGTIRCAREDVGRHTAFDKLIGAMLRGGIVWDGGFALLSSRCSYELVEKAALAGCATLVTVSAATSLAVDRAREAGITLVPLARDDAVLAT